MALYPPIMANIQEAFTGGNLWIRFTLSNVNSLAEVTTIGIKVVQQSNNKSIAKSDYPDGVIYKLVGDNVKFVSNNTYMVRLDINDLSPGWTVNTYYKIQLCFCTEAPWNSSSGETFAKWKSRQIVGNSISEWSTVMVTKVIPPVIVEIANEGAGHGGSGDLIIESSNGTELTTTPMFFGSYTCAGEAEDKYKFQLYTENGELLEDTGWIQHVNIGGLDSVRFDRILSNDTKYKVSYSVITVNNYTTSAEDYEFTVHQNFLTQLENVTLLVEDKNIPYCNENGCLRIRLTTEQPLSGNYVITRSSEKSGYTIWEDIKFLIYQNHSFKNEIIFTDFTVESGIKYKYAFQQENNQGLRTSPVYEGSNIEDSPERECNFYFSYLYNNNVQLKLRFNNNMSSFKHTVLASKQDTLGSKYPTINRNGDAYYAEFPVNGLISLKMDDFNTFFQEKEDGYYYKDEKVISKDKYIISDTSDPNCRPKNQPGGINTFNQNLTDNNIFIERIYREKVEEFLNDGGYKLYKSPTEGNIVVTLMNVSMTPEQKLGRMIFSFSATAYEVLDNTISNLNEYKLIDIGKFKDDITGGAQTTLIGQLSGLFTPDDNLYTEIKRQNEYDIGGGYEYSFLGLRTLQIEAYPDINFDVQLNELKDRRIIAINDNDSDTVEDLTQQIKELEELQSVVQNQIASPIITLYIDGQEISLGANRIYRLSKADTITSIKLKYKQPVVINYTCYVTSQESKSSTVSAVTTTSAWGQLAGIFTETKKVLNNYQYDRTDELLVQQHNNYSIFQSLDITEIIRERVRRQAERQYKTSFYWDKNLKMWTDGILRYEFEQFTYIEIEADEGTNILIYETNSPDEIPKKVAIGKTNKYRLNKVSSLATKIRFEKPTYAIINYRCLTMQMRMGSAS